MVTVDMVKDYLGIDYVDDMVTRSIERIIKVADAHLKGAIGEDYPDTDPRAEELQLVICDDLYSKRGLKDSVSGNTRKLIDDFHQQLILERRRKNASL